MATVPGGVSAGAAWSRWAAGRRRAGRRRWALAATAALVWLLDVALVVRSGLYDPAVRWGLGDVLRWEFAIAGIVSVAVLLAWSRLPPVHAWACLALLCPFVGFDLGWPRYSQTSAPYLGAVLTAGWPVAAAAFVLRYPAARLSPAHRRWTAALLLVLPTLGLLELLTLDPDRIGRFGDGRLTLPWPPEVHDRWVFPALAAAEFAALAVTAGLQVRRWRAASRDERPALAATAMAVGLVAVVVAATRFVQAASWWMGAASADVSDWSRWTQMLATSWVLGPVIPALAALVGVFQTRAAQAASVGGVALAARDGLGEPLDRAVRTALGDASSAVLGPGDAASSGRSAGSCFPVPGDGGEVLAVLVADRAADGASGGLVPAVVDALGLGLRNRRLHAARRAVAANLADSRAAAVEAALDERRRVERDLHDGVQQALLGVSAVLARADLVDDPATLRAIAADARERLLRARADLDRLTSGLQPAELSLGGLGRALPELAAGAEIDVRLTMPVTGFDVRLPSAVEATVYFVVAEALSNALKHAGASEVEVSVVRGGGSLQVVVSDDGLGGARLEPGGGLAGLAARVAAVGGRLEVTSEPDRGSRIVARMPFPG